MIRRLGAAAGGGGGGGGGSGAAGSTTGACVFNLIVPFRIKQLWIDFEETSDSYVVAAEELDQIFGVTPPDGLLVRSQCHFATTIC